MCMCMCMPSLIRLLTGTHARRRFLHTAALTLQGVLSILSDNRETQEVLRHNNYTGLGLAARHLHGFGIEDTPVKAFQIGLGMRKAHAGMVGLHRMFSKAFPFQPLPSK